MPDLPFFSWLRKKSFEMFRIRAGIQIGNALILLKPVTTHGQWKLVLRSTLDVIVEEPFSTQEIRCFFDILYQSQSGVFTYSSIIKDVDMTVEHKIKTIYITFLLQGRDRFRYYLYRKDIESAYLEFSAYLKTMEGT